MKIILSVLIGVLFISGCTDKKKEAMKEYKVGIEYYKSGDIEKALTSLNISCDDGLAVSCYLVGTILESKVRFYNKWYYGPDIHSAYSRGCKLKDQKCCTKLKKWQSYKIEESSWWEKLLGIIVLIIIILIVIGGGGGRRGRRIDTDTLDNFSYAVEETFNNH